MSESEADFRPRFELGPNSAEPCLVTRTEKVLKSETFGGCYGNNGDDDDDDDDGDDDVQQKLLLLHIFAKYFFLERWTNFQKLALGVALESPGQVSPFSRQKSGLVDLSNQPHFPETKPSDSRTGHGLDRT